MDVVGAERSSVVGYRGLGGLPFPALPFPPGFRTVFRSVGLPDRLVGISCMAVLFVAMPASARTGRPAQINVTFDTRSPPHKNLGPEARPIQFEALMPTQKQSSPEVNPKHLRPEARPGT